MPRKFFRKHLPDADTIRRHHLVARFGGFLQHPNLWHLNRDSVSRAVAIGLFAGLIPGPLQMLTAIALAIPLHCNLPLALLMTLYTNPFTIVPLYLLGYEYGKLLLGVEGNHLSVAPFEMDWTNLAQSMRGVGDWMLSMGRPLAVGLVALAITLAVVGYFLVQWGWRLHVVLAWRARKRRRNRPPSST